MIAGPPRGLIACSIVGNKARHLAGIPDSNAACFLAGNQLVLLAGVSAAGPESWPVGCVVAGPFGFVSDWLVGLFAGLPLGFIA